MPIFSPTASPSSPSRAYPAPLGTPPPVGARTAGAFGRDHPTEPAGSRAGSDAFGALAALVADGVLVVDARDRVASVNDAALQLLGATRGALVGHDAPTALDRLGHGSAALALDGALAHPEGGAFTVHDAAGHPVTRWHVAPAPSAGTLRPVVIRPAAGTRPAAPPPLPLVPPVGSAADHAPAGDPRAGDPRAGEPLASETLAGLARALAGSGADVAAALERLAAGARALLAASGTCVVTLDGAEARVDAAAGTLVVLRGHVSRVMDPPSLFAEAVAHGRVVITNAAGTDVRVDPRYGPSFGMRHVLVAPLVIEGEVAAVLCAVDSARGGFSAADGELAQRLADFGALALHNRRLVVRAEESAREARLLAGAARALVEHVSPEGLYAAVARLARESLGASGSTVILADPVSGRVERVWADGAGHTMPSFDVAHFWASGMGRAARDATPVFFSSPAALDAPTSDRILVAAAESAGVGAAALLPIGAPGPDAASATRGLLSILFPEPRTFSPRERRLLADFGAHVAMAARNAALLASREQARARAEAAAEIAQAALDARDAAAGAAAILAVLDRVAPTAGKALRVADDPAPGTAAADAGALVCLAASGNAASLRGRRFPPGTRVEAEPGAHAWAVPLAARGRELGDLWVSGDAPGETGLSAAATRDRLVQLAAPVAVALDALLLGERARRRQREDQLLAEQLRQAEKMAALGELVAGVAHEINNPLTGISAFAELLLDESLPPEQRESARLIKREADRAVAVVRDLLMFSRKAEPAALPVDLNAVVQRTLSLRGYALRDAGIAVHLDLDPALPRVRGDEGKLQQVVLNVVLNAEYALREAPVRRLQVRTRRVPATADRGEQVLVAIADSGPGMSPETLARVFEPFFTTKPPGDGTGLGLSVSYGIVQTHGGEIVARGAPGAGATFEILLPVDELDAPADPLAPFVNGLP